MWFLMYYSRLLSDKSCSICGELAEPAAQIGFEGDGSNLGRAPRSLNFSTLPSLGALVVGHALIVTQVHTGSVLLYADKFGRWSELRELVAELAVWLSDRLGVSEHIVFEQGSHNPVADLCSTSHAHLHVVPVSQPGRLELAERLRRDFAAVKLQDLGRRCSEVGDFVTAAWVDRNGMGEDWSFSGSSELPPQYMRKLIGETLGLQGWDWKRDPRSATYRRTSKLFSGQEC